MQKGVILGAGIDQMREWIQLPYLLPTSCLGMSAVHVFGNFSCSWSLCNRTGIGILKSLMRHV
jgi:hypothetical protein